MQSEPDERMTRLTHILRDARLRVTPQRLAIYEEVARTDAHPDAERVFRHVRGRMPTVSLDTVYRTLAMLEEMGLVSRVEAGCERARFDANTDPHHHLICTRCGLVRDFQSETADQFAVPPGVEQWGRIDTVHIQVRGVCAGCIDRGQGDDAKR